MKNRVTKQDVLIEKVLEMLESMADVTASKIEERVYLCKGKLQFGFIENQEIYLVDRYKYYNKFSKPLETEWHLAKDELLLAATKAYLTVRDRAAKLLKV